MKKAIFTVLLPSGRYRINSGQTAPSGMTVSAAFDPMYGPAVDTAANEVFVADGYGNRRVAVFDSETGAYKRHSGE